MFKNPNHYFMIGSLHLKICHRKLVFNLDLENPFGFCSSHNNKNYCDEELTEIITYELLMTVRKVRKNLNKYSWNLRFPQH